MPDLYNVQFTRFENPNIPCSRDLDTWRMVPIHYIREWQFPKNARPDDTAVFKTVRISEHRWPTPNTFRCSRNDVEWPASALAADRLSLIDAGLLVPWVCYPRNDEPFLMLDDIAENVHARDSETGRGGLPEDYLEFWLETSEM